MNYLYGDSYGGVEQSELARDSARDSRYFQSLQANRALQAQALQQAQMEQQAAQHQDQMGLDYDRLDQQSLMNALASEESKRQFEENLKWHNGNLTLEKDKFDFSKSQPTPAQVAASEAESKRAEEAQHTFRFSKNLADMLNQYSDLSQEQQQHQARIAKAAAIESDYTKNHSAIPFVGTPQSQYDEQLAQFSGDATGAPTFDVPVSDRVSAIRAGITEKIARNQAKLDTLGEIIHGAMKSGGGDYVTQDPKTGRFLSTMPEPPAFDFSKMGPLSTRPGLPPAAAGPQMAPRPSMLPAPSAGASAVPAAPVMTAQSVRVDPAVAMVKQLMAGGMSYKQALQVVIAARRARN